MKSIKKCLLALLVLCMVVGVLAACGDDTTSTTTKGDEASTTTSGNETTTTGKPVPEQTTEPDVETNTYTFTVVYGDTNLPVEGVMVQLCHSKDGFCLMPATTDAEGKVVYSLGNRDYDVYDVHIMRNESPDDDYFFPEGYSFDNTSVKTNATDTEYTLVLVKNEG